MEQRIALTQGSNVKQYIIDDVIGFGASCLVYRAHFLDNANHQKDVILKECYPYNAGTTRIGNKIIWSNTEERDTAFQRFHHAYDVASEIQNTANAKSVSAYSLEILNENGTQYVITIPNGDSYDKTKSNDIADIVRTALALTNAVGLYHKAGYLHLDIKPSNFIATADQTGQGKNIVLFDVDSVVSIGDIQNGKLRGVSYSKEYAAPEQKQQKVKSLCPATDLFSVGAVLFERIMNRRPDCTDSCMFAEWEFDSRFDIKNVKPKAKRLLTEIFHKTLSANIKRRYQSADELAAALEELRKVICEPAPYIYSYPLDTTCHFVGRIDELTKLHCALEDSSLVFVRGVGGIGKTELMRKYLSIHQDEYDAVVFMLYNGSVSECLQDIEIIGVDSQDKDKKSLLKEICDNDKILLVLDNYDVAPNESEDLEALLDLNCKVIVTTRTDFTERNPSARFIEVAGLSEETLQVIFENESELTLSNSEFEELKPILSIGKQCTYFWSMIARLVKEGAYTVSEIAKKVSDGLEDLEESEEIFDTKDGSYINTTVAAALLVLFNLDKLNHIDFEVLKAMYFLDCLNMDKRQIKEMLTFSETKLMTSFNTLVKKGYIQKFTIASREVYHISDVLKNVLEYREELDISKSELVTAFIEEKLSVDNTIVEKSYDSLPLRDQIEYIFACLFKIFSNVQWHILGNIQYCIDKLYTSSMGEERVFRSANNDSAIVILDNIIYYSQNSQRDDINQLTIIKAIIIRITWYCSWFLNSLLHYEQTDPLIFAKTIEKLFNLAIIKINSNHIADSELIEYLCKPIVKAIKHNYKMGYWFGWSNYNFFSSDTINKIITINPPCLINDNANIFYSFKVVCLRNNEYEKIYLKKVLEEVKKTKRSKRAKTALLAIIFISLNGKAVSTIIDDELMTLRRQVLYKCHKLLIGSYFRPKLNKSNIFSIASEIAPSEINESSIDIVIDGITHFYESILSTKVVNNQKPINKFSAVKDVNGNYCIDLFLSSIDKINSSECLYYFISEFENIVKTNCSFELGEQEKQKYILAAKRLDSTFKELLKTGSFNKVLDESYNDPLGTHYIDSLEFEAKLNNVIAVMYVKLKNYDLAYSYMMAKLEYTKSIIKKTGKITDDCFATDTVSLIYYGASHLAVQLLYCLIGYARDVFEIKNDADTRLYPLYYWLMLSANSAKEELHESGNKFDNAIILPTNDKTSYQLNMFTTEQNYDEIIIKYSKLIRQISGQEYYP